jgi:hypothetical protein
VSDKYGGDKKIVGKFNHRDTWLREALGGTTLEAATLSLGEASPDSKSLVVTKCVFQAF